MSAGAIAPAAAFRGLPYASVTGGDLMFVQPGDTAAAIEQALGFSRFQNPVDGSRFGEPDFQPAWARESVSWVDGRITNAGLFADFANY